MTCSEALPLIGPYIDRELDLRQSLEIERHVEECHACAAELRSFRELRDALSGEGLYFSAPPEMVRALRPRTDRSAAPGGRAARGRGIIIGATSVAVVATLALCWMLLRPPSAGPGLAAGLAAELVSDHVRSLQADHLTDVLSSDQHTVKPWFNGRVDFSPHVIDPTGIGFPLQGGRLDYIGGRSVAVLVYRRRGHEINLYTWPSPEPETGITGQSERGYNLLHWRRGGMEYWAISDLNPTELRVLAEAIRR
jgi:anti-sigma factor RsiW